MLRFVRYFPFPYIDTIHHGSHVIISISYYRSYAEDMRPFQSILLQIYVFSPVQIYG